MDGQSLIGMDRLGPGQRQNSILGVRSSSCFWDVQAEMLNR